MRSGLGGTRAGITLVAFGAGVFALSCQHATMAHRPAAPPSTVVPAPAPAPPPETVDRPPVWPETLAHALTGRGEPHAQPLALPRDARGRSRWLVFLGSREVAWGAWRVSLAADGTAEIEPVERWPTGVKVIGGLVEGGVAYVLPERLRGPAQP